MKNHLLTLMMLSQIIGVSGAQESSYFGLNDVSQSVQVTVMVNKKARIELTKNISEVTVTSADIARGYLEITDAVNLLVWCNSLEGVQVSANLRQGISDPQGRILSRGLVALRTSAGVDYSSFDNGPLVIYESSNKEKSTPVRCSLRLYLPPGSTAGLYRLDLSFEAIPK
jgi:hypothetical protein